MKNLLIRASLPALAFIALALPLVAQSFPELPQPGDGVEAYIPWVEAIYAAFVLVGGWLSGIIPGFNKIPDKALRVAAIALVGAGIFLIADLSSAVPLFISYVIATNLYDLLLKKIAPTPDTPQDIRRKEKQLEKQKEQLKKNATA